MADYQQNVLDRHRTFRSNITTVFAQIALFTDLADLNNALLAALQAMGIPSRAALRSRFGLPSYPTTQNEREEWLLDVVNTVVINGRYMMQTPGGIELQPYRDVYSRIGLTALESGLSSGADYKIHVIHDGIVYQDTSPKSVAKNLGIQVSQLDEILFVWHRRINPQQRNSIIAQGIPGSALYSVMSGQSTDDVTVVLLERIDFIDKLRSMGLSSSDLELLFTRAVEKVTIDTQDLRPGDSEDSLPGPYQYTPYPNEIARALLAEIIMYPTVGEKTAQGATVYVAPVTILVRALDHGKTFGGADLIRRTSDKIGSDETIGQAVLAISDTQISEITKSFEKWQPSADHFIEQGALAEETMAFFGIGADCGTNTNSGEGFNFWDTVLTTKQEVSIDNLLKEWKDVTSNINFAGDLLDGLSISMVSFTCEALALGCQGNNLLPDQGAEGGPYDQDGGTGVALEDLSDVLKATERMFEAFQDIGPNLAVTTIGLGNLKGLRTEPCESPANVSFFNSLASSDEVGTGNLTLG